MDAEIDITTRKVWALWAMFAICSLGAVVIGCWVASVHGVPARSSILNLAAWALGAGLAAVIARMKRDAALVWIVLAGAALILSLVSPGLLGVHRWIGLGPVRLNSAELLLPVALVACAGLGAESLLRLLFPLFVAVLLVFQPDVSQAVAVAGASAVLLLTSNRPAALRISIAMVLALAVVIAGRRPDPLAPVAEVEGIILLAAAISPAIAALAVAALAGATLAPLTLWRSSPSIVRNAATGLTVYLGLSGLAPIVGAYPVPLVGMGVSPILGVWLGIGWLMHLALRARRQISIRPPT